MGFAHGTLCRTLDPKGSRVRPFSPVYKKRKNHFKVVLSFFRAGKGTRTLDPDLGKVVLYQLSYSREVSTIIEY